jgi:diguanylate cyclase (GGDEF)-like protein/PAS domain S-box-containing protein
VDATPPNADAPTRASWTAPAVLLAVAAAAAVSFTTGVGTLLVRTSLVTLGIALVALGLRVRRPTPMRPWLFVLAGLASSLLGDVLVLVDALTSTIGASAADGPLTALAGALLLLGMVDASTQARGGDAGGRLDAVLGAIAGGTLLWHVVVIEAAAPGWIGTGAEVAGFVQVLSLVAVFALLVRARQSLPADRRTAATLLLLALLASLAAFLVGAARDAAGLVEQYVGARAGLGAAANLLVGIAILHPSMTAITAPRRPRPERLTRGRLLLLAGAMLVPPGIHVVEHVRGHDGLALGVTAGWLLLVPTVLTRVYLLMRAREEALIGAADADRRLASMLAHTGDLLLLVRRRPAAGADDADPLAEVVVEYASPAAHTLLGISPTELEGRDPVAVVSADDRADVARLLAASADWPASVDVRVVHADGSWHWCEVEVDDYLDDPAVAIVCLRDIDARKTVELGLSEAASRDELTGLLNRRGLFDRIDRLERPDPTRGAGPLVGCLAVDLDGFKAINDRLGHVAGDEVLRLVGRRLTQVVRDGDTVGRPGGDEFVVLCPSVASLDDLYQIAERILVSVERPMALRDGPMRVGVSIGVACLRDGESPEAVYVRADAALLTAKATGKGRIVVADGDAGWVGPGSEPAPTNELEVASPARNGHGIVTSP